MSLARLDELVRLVSDEQRERVLRPLFAGFLDLARQQGKLSAQIANRCSTLNRHRQAIRELAHELGVDDPCAGLPLPSDGITDRITSALENAGITAHEEFVKCRRL